MTPAEAAEVLESSCAAYASLLRSLPPEVAAWRPSPDQWCVKECVGHVIVAEQRAFAGRIRSILDIDEPQFEAWDAAEAERGRHDDQRSSDELLQELEAMRRSSVEMLRALRPDQLQRGGTHPHVTRLTVNDLLHEWVHHDANHLRQAYAVVQAYVWPDMGNARRFSEA